MSETAPDGDESGTAAPKRKGKGKRKHTVLKVVAISVVLLGLVTGLAVTYAYRHLSGNITTADFTEAVRGAASGEGVDRSAGRDQHPGDGQRHPRGRGQQHRQPHRRRRSARTPRSSSTSPRTGSAPTGSASRATPWSPVPTARGADGEIVPGGTDVMWNEAFNLAGPGCTISQFEQTTGVPVDHHVVLDFQGFQDMVDAVNGVQVCIPETVDDRAHGIYLEAGTREISGKEALSYVRQRYAVGDGSDLGRLKRQQAFMSAMANKVVSAGTLANPVTLVQFLDAATKSLTVDSGLGNLSKLAKLGYQFKDIGLVQDPVLHDPVGVHRATATGSCGPSPPPRTSGTGSRTTSRSRPGRPATRSRPGTCPARPRARPRPRAGRASPTKSPTATPSGDAAEEAAAAGLCT